MGNVNLFELFSEYQNLIDDFVGSKVVEAVFHIKNDELKVSKQKMDEATKKIFEIIKANDNDTVISS